MSVEECDAEKAAVWVIESLRARGYEALLAGGCVRDRLLSITPKDYDVATGARPEQVKEVFPRARKVGAKFGVMRVRKFGREIEVATFRSDGPYSDGRHPDEVTFGSEIEDAQRRDFTINGMFFDPKGERVIDHVNGRADLAAKILRTIGDPDRRFAEDHLRMLRAVRFAARLGFSIEAETFQAVRRLAPQLATISAERIWQELEAILTPATRAAGWQLLVDTGLRNFLSASWRPEDSDEDVLIARRLEALPEQPIAPALALAVTLLSRGPQEAANIGRSLRIGNRVEKSLVWLVGRLPILHDESRLDLADLKLLMVNEDWPSLLELLRANQVAKSESLKVYHKVGDRTASVRPEQIAPRPLLNGDDLASLGIKPGRRFGLLLNDVYREQLNERILTRDQAVAFVRSLLNSV